MNTRGVNVDDRAVRGDGPARRPRSRLLAVGAAALVTALLGIGALPTAAAAASGTTASPARVTSAAAAGSTASATSGSTTFLPGATPAAVPAAASGSTTFLPGAEPAATPAAGTSDSSPAATATPTPVPQNQLTPRPDSPSPTPSTPSAPVRPTIADPGDITSGTVRFHGTGTPGHALRVVGPEGTGCTATVGSGGAWACIAAVRSGPQQVFAVQDRTDAALGSAKAPASDVIVPPVVTTARPTSGPVSGTGHPGSTVTVTVAGSPADRSAVVGADGRWTVSLASGATGGDARVTLTATQTASTADGYRSDLRSAASAPVTLSLDRTAPAAPRVVTPGSGDRITTQPLVVSGSGEARAVLTVYVDRAPVCRTEVPASGVWTCRADRATVDTGPHEVTATQQDAAGNFSRSSAGVPVLVVRASPTAIGSGAAGGPTNGSTGTATGATGSGEASGHGGPGTTASGASAGGPGSADGGGTAGSGGDTAGSGTGGAGTGGSGTGGSGPRGGDWSGSAGDWTAATTYDSTVPTIQASFSWRTVLVATAVAAGFLLLVAGPLALFAGNARGRLRWPSAGLLGRNRSRSERRPEEDLLPSWASVAVAVGVVAVCTVLGVGIAFEARYVRLAIAVVTGAGVLAATVVLASRWAAGTDRHTIRFRVSPWLVLAALVACGITRAADLSPALVVGAVLVPVARPGLGTGPLRIGTAVAAGARSATWRSVALLVVAAAGWVLHSMTPGTGLVTSFVSEFATTLCVGGVGAVVTTLLPVAGSAGSALVHASRGRYAGIAAVAVALAVAVSSGPSGTHLPPALLGGVAAACAVVALGAVVWSRLLARSA